MTTKGGKQGNRGDGMDQTTMTIERWDGGANTTIVERRKWMNALMDHTVVIERNEATCK